MIFGLEVIRLWSAAGIVLVYGLMCAAIVVPRWRKRRADAERELRQGSAPAWIVAYASQTGSAEELAHHTTDMLRLAGVPTRCCTLEELTADQLARVARLLIVVSTYGEGDPPDNGAMFADQLMKNETPLPSLHYGILGLGDSSYTNFCGFSRLLDQRLRERGAAPLFERIEADRVDPAALDLWRHHLSHLAGTSDLPDWSGPEFQPWIMTERRQLNPGSAGEAVFHLAFKPPAGNLPHWQSGDLLQMVAPAAPFAPREYSIASVPQDGQVELLVRLQRAPGGASGIASGFLGEQSKVGGMVNLRLRAHRRFRLEDNLERPLILIGNGTGIAGLRSHIKARAHAGVHTNWLIFGERNAEFDYHYRDELLGWSDSGVLERLDMVFSRDQPQGRYVQDCVKESGATIVSWIGNGAAIYVCGSLKGMAGGVDHALEALLGRPQLDTLASAGRYRRDVY